MKKGIVLGCVFGLLLLCGYYGMGLGTEKILKRNIDILNQSSDVHVSLENYQRGWFHSHADLKWQIKIPESGLDHKLHRTLFVLKKTKLWVTPLSISHGPIMWLNSKLRFGLGYASVCGALPSEIDLQLANYFNTNESKIKYQLGIFVSYFNKIILQLNIPKYKMTASSGGNFFQWQGMASQLMVSVDKLNYAGKISLNGLAWKNKQINGSLGPVNGSFKAQQVMNNLFTGTTEFHSPSLVLSYNDLPAVHFNNMDITSNSNVKSGLYDSSVFAKFTQKTDDDKVTSDYALNFSFHDLDAEVLANMNRKLHELQLKTNDKLRLFWALIPDLPALLSKGAHFSIDNLVMNRPNDHLKITLNLSLPNKKYTNPIQLVQKINGDSRIIVSKNLLATCVKKMIKKILLIEAQKQSLGNDSSTSPALRAPLNPSNQTQNTMTYDSNKFQLQITDSELTTKAELKIKEWVEQGVITPEGNDFSANLKLLDGKLFINEHPFSFNLLAI